MRSGGGSSRAEWRRRCGASLEALVQSGPAELVNKPGGIFLRKAAELSAEGKMLFEAAARVILRDSDGTLIEQLSRPRDRAQRRIGSAALRCVWTPASAASEPRLFDNGMGGFTPDGREYVISLRGERPPAPWTNVLANPDFGCLVTEAGGGYTWAGNSQMNRLTPWSNDPVSDRPCEVVYLRDEETGSSGHQHRRLAAARRRRSSATGKGIAGSPTSTG